MKKQLLLAAGAAMLLTASCDKESESTMNQTIYTLNYITGVTPTGAPDGEASISSGAYTFNFNIGQQNCTLNIENLPSDVSSKNIVTPELSYSTNPKDGSIRINPPILSGSGLDVKFNELMFATAFYAAPTDVTITGVPSQATPSNYFGYLLTNYTVNNTYLVRTLFTDMVFKGNTMTSVNGTPGNFSTEDILYRVYFTKLDKNEKKANMVIYNAKFAEAMPVKVNLLLEDLDVVLEPAGIRIKGENVVPKMSEGYTTTPATNFPFDKIEFVIGGAVLNSGYCNYEVAGKYTGIFTGNYLFISSEK